MLSKSKLSALSLAVLASLGVQAQSLPEPLVAAARKAVLSNPEVQARFNAFRASGDERDIARAGYFPKVDLSATYGRENRTTPTTNFGEYNYNAAELTINQMLFDGLFTPNEAKRLGFAKLTRYYELAEIAETTSLEAVKAYADVVRYRELVETATQNYIEHKQTTLQVEERAKSGVGRRVDVEQANGRLALAESNLLTELTNLHDVSARYLRVVGEKPPLNLPYLSEQFRLGTLPLSVQELMRDGQQGSPTLHAAVENARAYRTAIDSSKAAYMPRLDLRAYGSVQDNNAGTMGATRVNGVALVLNYNLFRGGADKARESLAVNQSAQALDLKEKTCREVRQNLATAYSDAGSLLKQKAYLDQHRLSTEKAREAYRQQFDIGQRTLLDLLDSQNEFFEASRSYTNAHYNQIIAQARTQAAMGRLVQTLNVQRADMPAAADAGQQNETLEQADLCPQEEIVIDTLEQIKARAFIPQRSNLPASYVVLLPSPDGTVGKVIVQGKQGEKSLVQAQQAVALDGGGPTFVASDALVQKDFSQTIAAMPPLPQKFVLYFVSGKTVLTPQSQALLPQVQARVKERQAVDLTVTGHTDTMGGAEANEALALQRAQTIAKELENMGILGSGLMVESYGERNLLVATPDNKDEPRNRRVEITVR